MNFKQKSSPIKQGFIGNLATNLVNTLNPAQNTFQTQQGISSSPTNTAMQAAIQGFTQKPQNGISGINNISNNNKSVVSGLGNIASNLAMSLNTKTNMNQRPQTPISPKAFSNQGTIANLYGSSMPRTFNRNMSPLAQTLDPLTGQIIDPTMSQDTSNMNPVIQGDTVAPPPYGVELPITPTYDINQ